MDYDSSKLSKLSLHLNRLTPPKILTKVACKAKQHATGLLNQVRNRLESPMAMNPTGRIPKRRQMETADRSNNNVNHPEPYNDNETSSMKTTSTSSSGHSGFLGFTLPTTIDPNEPLPLPTCRLGQFQAEWHAGEQGSWRFMTENAILAPIVQEGSTMTSLQSLRTLNRALKDEQMFLKAKLEILYDNLVKQTALVHHHERKLEKLRRLVKHNSADTHEDLKAAMRRELEEKLEKSRSEQNAHLQSLNSEDSTANTDNLASDSTDLDLRSEQTRSLTKLSTDSNQTTLKTPSFRQNHLAATTSSKVRAPVPGQQRKLPDLGPRPQPVSSNAQGDSSETVEDDDEDDDDDDDTEEVDRDHSESTTNTTTESKSTLTNRNPPSEDKLTTCTTSTMGLDHSSVTSESDSSNLAKKESHTEDLSDSEESRTETSDETRTVSDRDDEDPDAEESETNQNASTKPRTSESDEDDDSEEEYVDEEEDLSKTEESQSDAQLKTRPRVVQFGKVCRRGI